MIKYITLILFVTPFLNSCNSKKQDSTINEAPDIISPYFGQKPPGLMPEIFAPGIVSLKGRVQGSVSFSPNLNEMYFFG